MDENQNSHAKNDSVSLAYLLETDEFQKIMNEFHDFSKLGLSIIFDNNSQIFSIGRKNFSYSTNFFQKWQDYHGFAKLQDSEYGMNDFYSNLQLGKEFNCLIIFGPFFCSEQKKGESLDSIQKGQGSDSDLIQKLKSFPVKTESEIESLEKFLMNILTLFIEKTIKDSKANQLTNANDNFENLFLLYQNIFENLPIGLQIFDEEGFSFANNIKQRELLGITDSKSGIGTFNVLNDPYSIAHGVNLIYQKVYAGEKIHQKKEYDFSISENNWETRKGKRVFQESIFPVYAKSNRPRAIALLEDITDKEAFELKIKESEQKYRQLVENIPGIIYIFSLKKGGIYYSPYVTNVLGYSPEYLYANPLLWNQSIHPEDKIYIAEALKDLKKDDPFYLIYRVKDSSGNWIWLEDRLINMNEIEDDVWIEGLAFDITEKVNSELELKKSEEKYRNLINSLKEGIVVYSINGEVLTYNKSSLNLLNLTENELSNIKSSISTKKWIKDNGKEFFYDDFPLERTFRTGRAEHGTIIGIKTHNHLRWVNCNTEPLELNPDGIPSSVIVTFSDITENVNILKKLKELNTTKDKFFSIIAHDLKNPFHALLGLSELLVMEAENNNSEKIGNYAKLISSSSKSGYELLVNLLEWSRLQSGKLEIRKIIIHINEIIETVIDSLSAAIHEKNLEIVRHISRMSIRADSNMLETILRNLLSNAIKFSHTGQKIEISAQTTSSQMVIAVKDYGIGISKENQEYLFQLDKTISTTGTLNEKGTGLGLHLCKEFIELHNGNIEFHSEPGKGTEFIIYLPLSPD